MVTECIVRAVYRTTCNRCRQVMPEPFEQRMEWATLDVRQGGAPGVPPADLCKGCKAEFDRFMEGKAVPCAPHD